MDGSVQAATHRTHTQTGRQADPASAGWDGEEEVLRIAASLTYIPEDTTGTVAIDAH